MYTIVFIVFLWNLCMVISPKINLFFLCKMQLNKCILVYINRKKKKDSYFDILPGSRVWTDELRMLPHTSRGAVNEQT